MTFTLADIARLAQVERPVVSMWRSRPLAGQPFPEPLPDGSFDPETIASWLEATGRGNNPTPRADLAITRATRHATEAELNDFLTLLAVRILLDEPLTDLSADDLVDAADGLDPDDEFLFREVDALLPRLEEMAAATEELCSSAWHPREAYERILHRRDAGRASRLAGDLTGLLVALARELLGDSGTLVDVNASTSDLVIHLLSDDEVAASSISLPTLGPTGRDVLRRYLVHGAAPRRLKLDENWPLTLDSVLLARLPDDADAGLDHLNEIALQLEPRSTALVLGPAATLVDPLQPSRVAERDRLLRDDLVRAAIRLPQGLTEDGSRQHLALWVMSTPAATDALRTADLSGTRLTRRTAQVVLDDVLASLSAPTARAFGVLTSVDRARLVASGGSLVETQAAQRAQHTSGPSDDAIRLTQLRAALRQPLPDPMPFDFTLGEPRHSLTATLAQVITQGWARMLPGARIGTTEPGTTRLWTPDAVRSGSPQQVDLLTLTQQHPHLALTEPGDIIVITQGQPAAIVDRVGGSAVAYPARVLRLSSPRLTTVAVADAINRLPAGNGKWRTWQLPLTITADRQVEELFNLLADYESQLRERQTLLKELRDVASRSVLSGSLTLTPLTADEKGQ